MKKNILTLFLLSVVTIGNAQQPVIVSIGGGISSPSSDLKSQAFMGNGYNLQGEVFIPFSRVAWDGSVNGSGRFAWGVIAGGTYITSKSLMPDVAVTQAAYKLYNGSLTIANEQKGSSVNNGFMVSAGLRGDFTFGRFTLSPSFSGGYFSIRQDGFAQRSTADSKSITLTELPETKNTGFTVIPQLKISYPITGNLSIYTSGSLLIGPEITTTGHVLVPAGGFNDHQTYEPSQLASGTMREGSVSTNYQALHVNAGVSWVFGRSSRRLRGKVTKPGDNGINPIYEQGGNSTENPIYNPSAQARPGTPIGGIVVKGGKNPGGNSINLITNENGEVIFPVTETGEYTLQITMPEAPGKSISEKGVRGNKRTVRTYTGGRKNEASNQNILAAPGNPIGGIIVKGGKNPGPRDMIVVSNQNGEVTFPVTEAGEYALQIIMPEASGKSISEKGVRGNKRTVRTYTGGRKNEASTTNAQARPGSPIGGILVKRGKKPGGNMMVITSNDKGEFELNGLETGNYQFPLTTPETPQGKSISEKGLKRNEAAEAARPGTPIGGIVVKGGKNPGGNMINLSVKEGIIQFDVLEAGDYKFLIQTPGNTNETQSKKKVVEKATSGLKDTLKTNV